MILDDKARTLAKQYKKCEADLLEVLMQMEVEGAFLPLGFSGIFDYCHRALKLGEAQSYYFQRVARKSREVPALKDAIHEGRITLSKARRIESVITAEDSGEWIRKAETLSQRELEREIKKVQPEVVRETLRPVAPSRSELRVGISEALEAKLRRLQDILGGTLEEVLEKAVGEALDRRDPVAKAERGFLRKRGPAVKNVVHWRDGQCTFPGCTATRFLQVHHIRHRAHGGSDAPENLALLCSAHHRMTHAVFLRQAHVVGGAPLQKR